MGVLNRLLGSLTGTGSARPEVRSSRRVAVAITGWLTSSLREGEVLVVDLSDGGAMVETAMALHEGERLVLSIDGWVPVPVLVRWARSGRAGLIFERQSTAQRSR